MDIAILIICSATGIFIFALMELMFRIRDGIQEQLEKIHDEIWNSKYKVIKRQPEDVDSELSEETKIPSRIKNADGN